MTQVSIIILSYNTKEFTLACIRSISQQYKKELEKGKFEIIVVDNASSDGTVATIQQFNNPITAAAGSRNGGTINKIKIIQNKSNVGFSKGNNIGAKEARGEYILFLNSDTEVKDIGIAGMVKFLDNNKNVGILGAKLVNEDGTLQPSIGEFYNLGNTFLMLLGLERLGLLRSSPKKITAVDWVSGAALMIRQKLFDKLSGFNKHFFMYMEDMELCFRAKKAGWQTFFYPDVIIVHKQLGSSNRTFAIVNIYKGLLYFYKKHANYMEYLIVKLLLTLKAYMAIVIGILTRNGYLTSTYRKALALL